MNSINPSFGPVPIASSLAGASSSVKQSSTEKSNSADGSSAKVVESANTETSGLMGSEKTADRDADGRQLYDDPSGTSPGRDQDKTANQPPLPRPKDPDKRRGSQLDLDA